MRRRAAGAAILVAAVLPAVVAVVANIGRSQALAQDPASIQLMVRDVFTAHTPLVGAYSRGFNHPGPTFFYLLAPLSALAGGATWALSVGAALIQGFGAFALVWLSLRRGGPWFAALMASALGLGYVAFDFGGQFRDAWNPFGAYPWFLVFLVLAWGFAIGNRYDVVGLAATGTFVVQCHIGYLPLVAAVVVWALVVGVWSDRRSAKERDDGSVQATAAHPSWRRVSLLTTGVLVVLWAAPIVEQLRHGGDGNLAQTWRYFREGGDALGMRRGAGLFAVEFKWWPPWLGGSQAMEFATGNVLPASVWWLLIPATILAVGWFATRRSGRRADRRLVELAVVASAATIVALSRITVAPYHYLFYWRIAVAVFVVAASIWAVGHALPAGLRHAPNFRRVAAGTLGLVLAIACVAQVADVVNGRDGFRHLEPAVASAMHQVETAGVPRTPVLVRSMGSTLGGFDQGVIAALDERGALARVDRQFGYHYGTQRTAAPSQVSEVWYLSEEGRYGNELRALPGAREIAAVSPLPRSEEQELRRLEARVSAALVAAGREDLASSIDSAFLGELIEQARRQGPLPGVDTQDVKRLVALNARVARAHECRCVIIAFPAQDAPNLPFTLG